MLSLGRLNRGFQKLIFSRTTSPQSSQMPARLSGLLQALDAASVALADALDAEAESGGRMFVVDPSESEPALARWRQCRQEVEYRQDAYHLAVTAYQQYVASLPRSLQQTATNLGLRAMSGRPA
jgi:hypothetical protein